MGRKADAIDCMGQLWQHNAHCQDIAQITNRLNEAVTSGECEKPTCITQHPGFNPVCINRWFLQAAWYQYKQQCKESFDGPEDKLYRHKTYKQLA